MYGIALEGGGTKGAYQIGAWKALKELKIKYNVVAGTSIGSINGVLMTLDMYEEALHIWNNMKPSLFINVNDNIYQKFVKNQFDYNEFHEMVKFSLKIMKDGGLDVSPLREFLSGIIDEEEVRKSNVKFGMVTVNLTDFSPVEIFIDDIPKGELIDYLIASCSLPWFQGNYIDGKRYLDGGFHDNLPLSLVASTGSDKIIAIEAGGFGRRKKIDIDGVEIIRIVPSSDTGKILDFDTNLALKNMKMGYYDTLKVFKKLKGQKYYIENSYEEKFFINRFSDISEKTVLNIGKSLGIRKISGHRMLFEKIIPEIANLLGLNSYKEYSDIFIGLYENYAEYAGIELYKLYSMDEFFKIVEEAAIKENVINDNFDDFISGLLKNTVLYKYAKKDKLLLDIFLKITIGNRK